MAGVNARHRVDCAVAIHHVSAAAAVHVQVDETGQHQRLAGAGRRNVRSVYGDDALAEAERAANPAVGGQDATGDLRGHGLWIGGFSRTTIVPVRSLVNSALLS